MEILVQYADALGAERFVDTNNVHLFVGFHPYPEVIEILVGDELASKFLLDTDEKIIVDQVKAFNTTHIWAMDLDRWQVMGAPESLHQLMESIRAYSIRTGIGAVVMRVPTVTDLNQDPTELIETGDWVKVDADRGVIEITKKG